MYTYVYGMCMNDPNIGERVHIWGCFRQYSMRGVRWYRWYVKRTTEFTWVCGGAPGLLVRGWSAVRASLAMVVDLSLVHRSCVCSTRRWCVVGVLLMCN